MSTANGPTRLQLFRVKINKKTSILAVKRKENSGYLALENGLLFLLVDGFIMNLSVMFIYGLSIELILSFGAAAFIIRKVFPSFLSILNSINLIKVGR